MIMRETMVRRNAVAAAAAERIEEGRAQVGAMLAIRFIWLRFHVDLNVMTNSTKICIKAYWVFPFV